jgi:hypothetical protein
LLPRGALLLLGVALAVGSAQGRFESERAAVIGQSAVAANVVVTGSSSRALSFTARFDTVSITPVTGRPEYSQVAFPDGVSIAQPGEPDVPVQRVCIGIPQHGEISVAAMADPPEVVRDVQVMPAIRWETPHSQSAMPIPVIVPGVQSAANAAPHQLVSVERIEMVRGIRCAFLLIAPVEYDPARRECRVAHQVDVAVRFAQPAEARAVTDPGAGLAAGVLLNGVTAQAWTAPTDTGTPRNFFDISEVWYRVQVESSGIYKVGYDDLKQAGADPQLIDPRTFRLFTLGEHIINQAQDSMTEVPLYVYGEGDSSFDRQDYVVFPGQSSSHWNPDYSAFAGNLFTAYNYYWLTWGGTAGQRIPFVARPPDPTRPALRSGTSRLRHELDRLCPARSGLLWVWQDLTKSEAQDSVSSDFVLPLRQPERITRLAIRLYSIDAGHNGLVANHLHIWFNGVLVDSVTFGLRGAGSPLDIAYNLDSLGIAPAADRNVLRLALVGDSLRTTYIDYFDITYECGLSPESGVLDFYVNDSAPGQIVLTDVERAPLIFDLTDPAAAQLVSGFDYAGDSLRFATAGAGGLGVYEVAGLNRLRTPLEITRRRPGAIKAGADYSDYIIVAPDAMYDAAQLLQRYRAETGIPGLVAPRIITVRLSEIYDEFAFGLEEPGAIKAFFALKRPFYGLLVGDATYDYRDNLSLHPAPGVPPYEVGADLDPNVYSSNAYAIDSWFADFEGSGHSPDMIIGRNTARSSEEFRRYLDKLRAYEHGQFGFWNRRLLLLADDEYLGTPGDYDVLATTHISGCERMAGQVGLSMDPVKVYLTEYPWDGSATQKPGAHDALYRQLANGALIWIFFGHGAGFQLCHEKAMSIEGVADVHNGQRLPFCFFASCGVGRWEDTKNECIAEELARKDDGAIAACGATKGTVPSSNEAFCGRMLWMVQQRDSSLGRAFYSASFSGDKLYHLLGEPTLRLRFPDSDTALATTPDTFRPGHTVDFSAGAPGIVTGSYAAAGFTDQVTRHYHSQFMNVYYALPGDEFFRGLGLIQGGTLRGTALVPVQTIGVRNRPDGTYTPQAGTGRVSVLGWGNGKCFSAVRDRLVRDTATVSSSDHTGPQITVFADGKRIYDGDYLPTNFTLSALLADSSGILISPVQQYDMSLYYYFNDPTQTPGRLTVADKFEYDYNSHTSGRFSIPATLPGTDDTIFVVAADNFLNRSFARVSVHTRIDEQVKIQNPLVFPNPGTGPGYFTFQLNRAARVTVQVYTISGRPVRVLNDNDCNLGHNQIAWDGLDKGGTPLPNGIYLYRLSAQTVETASGARRETSDKVFATFIVRR